MIMPDSLGASASLSPSNPFVRHRSCTIPSATAAVGDRNVAGDGNAVASRAKVCYCTSVTDIVAGETAECVLHMPSKPGLLPNFLRPPRVSVAILRERSAPGAVPVSEFEESQTMVRTAPSMRLKYGPLRRAGPFLLSVTIDGAHVSTPFCCAASRPLRSARPPRSTTAAPTCALGSSPAADHHARPLRQQVRHGRRVSVHDVSPEADADRLWATPPTALAQHSQQTQRAHDNYHAYLRQGRGHRGADRRDGTYEAHVQLRRADATFAGSLDGR